MDATSSPWTYLPVGSHARTSARQENGQALKELAAAFGLSSPVSLGSFDQDTCSLRTSQACLFTTGYEELSESFPDSGMWGSGEVYELQSSVPVTSESGSSSLPSEIWPTPRAQEDGSSPEAAALRQARSDAKSTTGGPHHKLTGLAPLVAMWPTARAEDSESCGNHPGAVDSLTGAAKLWPTATGGDVRSPSTDESAQRETDKHNLRGACLTWPTPQTTDAASAARHTTQTGIMHPGTTLTDAIRLWPTPTEDNANNCGGPSRTNGTYSDLRVDVNRWTTPQAHDAVGPKTPEQIEAQRQRTGSGVRNLNEDAAHWQTPGTDSFRSRGGDRKDEMGLDQEARHWGTPTTRDWKDGATSLENTPVNGLLGRQVLPWSSLPAPQIPDGPASSGNGQTSRRLSPRFVEFLMGFPIGFTEISKELCPTEPNASDD